MSEKLDETDEDFEHEPEYDRCEACFGECWIDDDYGLSRTICPHCNGAGWRQVY